jgi:hypothetical protein
MGQRIFRWWMGLESFSEGGIGGGVHRVEREVGREGCRIAVSGVCAGVSNRECGLRRFSTYVIYYRSRDLFKIGLKQRRLGGLASESEDWRSCEEVGDALH